MMSKQKIILPAVALVLLITLVIAMAGGVSDKLSPTTKEKITKLPASLVVTPKAYQEVVWLPANVIAQQNTQVASRILANVLNIHVRAGDSVKAGQLLAELDNKDLKAQVGQIEAQVAAVSAQLIQAQQQLARNKSLREKGLISVSELDQTQANYDQLNATKLSYLQQLDQAKVTLTFSQINAPIAGKVVDRMVEPGDLVNPGQAIVALYNPNSIQISSYVPESKAIQLQIGQQLEVQLDSLGLTHVASISEIVPLADSAARSFEVKLDLVNESKQTIGLMPGMYARLGIKLAAQNVIAINPKYIKSYGQLNKVDVLENGAITSRFIRLGKQISPNLVIVVAGLNEGEQLVI